MRGRQDDPLLSEMLAQIRLLDNQEKEVARDKRNQEAALRDSPLPKGPGPCPLCGARTVKRAGSKGFFYSCTLYPECRGSRNFDPAAAFGPGPCPTCNAPTAQRVGKFGLFYGCTKYPECKGTLEFNPGDVPSPGPRRKPKPKLFPVIEALPGPTVPLDPNLQATVPPLSPDLIDQPDDTVEQEDDFLFDG
jgi:ssDNA-binding Zn-finger/Zn-ribbon topoisomerase 1